MNEKIKIFPENSDWVKLERDVNLFISKNLIQISDIKFEVHTSQYGTPMYSVMIVYK